MIGKGVAPGRGSGRDARVAGGGMRNLLGRLHARPGGELTRIAAFWQAPALPDDKHARVAALYRTMTDPRAARSAWDRLAGRDRELVRLLAIGDAGDGAATLAELADRLGVSEADARQTATSLYRVGILAREGDDDPLPVGATARLFLPRELALLFRRVQDEIDAGDLADTPLRALAALLDDAEIEDAAVAWGVRVLPGLRARADLTQQLLRRVGDAERLAAVVARLRPDAARLWRLLREEPDDAAIPLADAAAAVGLGDDDPRSGERLRAALAQLESTLLVWHSYRSDGSRWLFVPSEIRTPRPAAAAELPPLAPIAAPAPPSPPWRHQDALAWDLLTLLRDIADPHAPPWPVETDPPRPRLLRLNRRLWHQGADVPPPGYLDLLISLARSENLLAEQGDDHPRLVPTAAGRPWRERTFGAQSDRLRWWWQASTEWVEGRARAEVEVWGADWRGARRKLAALLPEPAVGLEPGVWYALESVAARLAAHDPDLLGATFTAATARHASGEDARAAAIAEVVAVELATAFAWFGLVEVADLPGQPRAVRRPDETATAPADGAAGQETSVGAALAVSAEGEVELRIPSPLRVWALSAFAEPTELGRVSRYRLSADGLERALAAGFDLDQVTTFLVRQGGTPLPPSVAERLGEWARGYRRVRLRRAVLLAPDDPADVPELSRIAAEAGWPTRPLDGSLLVEIPAEDGDAEAAVADLLRARGFAPHRATAFAGDPRQRSPGA